MLLNLKEPGELSDQPTEEELENIDQHQSNFLKQDCEDAVRISFTKKGSEKKVSRKESTEKGQKPFKGKWRAFKHKCDYCEEFLTDSFNKLNKHKFEKHEKTQCGVCRANFDDYLELKDHLQSHNNPPVKCDHCELVFTEPKKRKKHMKEHVSSKFVCQECGAVLLTKMGLEVHKAKHGDPNEKVPCPHCSYTTWTQNEMNYHIKSVHISKPSSCPYCGKLVKKLKNHLERIQCNVPENERILKKHKCELCDKTFSLKSGLKRHMEFIHGDRNRSIKCELCSYATCTKFNLFIHIRRMHEGKPLKSSCPYCFKEVVKLEHHIQLFHQKCDPLSIVDAKLS